MRVAILGASPKPERYAYRALKALEDHGHEVVLVNPAYPDIDSRPCFADLHSVEGAIHTITVYVSPEIGESLIDAMIAAKPKRAIFNPGSEVRGAGARFAEAKIEAVEACTLVMLSTGQF